MELGEALIKSNGQDISRRAKSKNLMVVLPTDFAFQKNTEGTLGYFRKLDSSNPELVIETEIGNLIYSGRYINTTSQYLSIVLQPRKNQSLCQDITSRLLIFDKKIGFSSTPVDNPNSSSEAQLGVDESLNSTSSWVTHFGCSNQADNKTIRGNGFILSRSSTVSSNGSTQKDGGKRRNKSESDEDEIDEGSDIDDDQDDSPSDSDASVMQQRRASPSELNRRSSGRLSRNKSVKYNDDSLKLLDDDDDDDTDLDGSTHDETYSESIEPSRSRKRDSHRETSTPKTSSNPQRAQKSPPPPPPPQDKVSISKRPITSKIQQKTTSAVIDLDDDDNDDDNEDDAPNSIVDKVKPTPRKRQKISIASEDESEGEEGKEENGGKVGKQGKMGSPLKSIQKSTPVRNSVRTKPQPVNYIELSSDSDKEKQPKPTVKGKVKEKAKEKKKEEPKRKRITKRRATSDDGDDDDEEEESEWSDE